jgi:SpoVK/Ycf46/Vps4 family AAA+-type ATPase
MKTLDQQIQDTMDDCEEEDCECNATQLRRQLRAMKNGMKGKYAFAGGGWTFCGDTAETLPADIYRVERGNFGPVLRSMDIKTDIPVPLPDSVSERIAKEVSNFWKLGAKFEDVGMLHKRGILLYGPAGAGKTSTACVVAKKVVGDNGIVFVLTNADFPSLQTAIGEIRQREPERPIVTILEDIDELVGRGMEERLLAFLDGEDQVNHIAHVATTNNLGAMGNRLTNRPSRFDIVIKVGMPSLAERHIYLKAKIGNTKEALKWAKETEGMSVAHLRELVVGVKCMNEDPKKVLTRLREMMGGKIKAGRN